MPCTGALLALPTLTCSMWIPLRCQWTVTNTSSTGARSVYEAPKSPSTKPRFIPPMENMPVSHQRMIFGSEIEPPALSAESHGTERPTIATPDTPRALCRRFLIVIIHDRSDCGPPIRPGFSHIASMNGRSLNSSLCRALHRDGGRPLVHRYKYAMPGDPLPVATLVGIHAASGKVVAFNDCSDPTASFSPYSSRRVWFGPKHTAWWLRLDRYCKQADLWCLDLRTHEARVVLSETASTGYLDFNPRVTGTPNVRTLWKTEEIIWFSERDGWGHLYLYDSVSGALKNRITSGEWAVRDIVHIDETGRTLLFLAGGIDPTADPMHRTLCSVNFDGSSLMVRLRYDGDIYVPTTEPSGSNQQGPNRPSYAPAGVSSNGRYAVVRYAHVARGNRTEVVDLRDQRRLLIASTAPESGKLSPRSFRALAADGKTSLHGVLVLPPDCDEHRRFPLIDFIYTGPQITHQPQAFQALCTATALALAELGFVTLMLDTRGMPTGSRDVHQIGYGQLLEPQLADHAAVVRQLRETCQFIDGQRIGVIGQSAGGAAAVRALCDYSDIYSVGVAICGNHDPTRYASFWSDKYRGPCIEPDKWAQQANAFVAHKLSGRLLLIAGDMDENVHPSQTLTLVDALIRANKNFEVLIVPNQGHDLLDTCGYVQRRVWDFFVRHLLDSAPPEDFGLTFEPNELSRYAKRSMKEERT
jgi:dipeptidyl-peptidase 4